MGQAFDEHDRVLGSAFGATKREVFEKLDQRHPDAHRIDVKHGGADYLATLDAAGVLDLIAAEFASDPTSVQCFDGRVVARAIELSKAYQARQRARASAPPHTKLNPGPYDCYAKLFDDEPYFVLRGKDPDAPALVESWANRRAERQGLSNPKIEEARDCAQQMRAWRERRMMQDRQPDDQAHERPSVADA